MLEDGKQLEVEIGFAGGVYYSQDLKQNISIERCSSYYEEMEHKILEQEKENDKNEEIPRSIFIISDNGNRKIISFNNKIDSLKVHRMQDYYQTLGVLDSKNFRKLEIISPLLKKIQKAINYGEYIEILNDAENPYKIKGVRYTADIDERSRKINFTKLRQDLLKIEQLLPGDKIGNLLQEQFIEKVLDRTFGTKKEEQENGKFKREDNIQNAYKEIIKQILNGENDEKKLEKLINILNQNRKKRVEENKKHVLVGFKDEEARKKFEELIRLEKLMTESKDERD